MTPPFDGVERRRETRLVAAKKPLGHEPRRPTPLVPERPLQAWAEAVQHAHWNLAGHLVDQAGGRAVDPRTLLGERAWQAVEISSYLAQLFVDPSHELQPVEASIIDRLADALQPRLAIEKALLATQEVAHHGSRFLVATAAMKQRQEAIAAGKAPPEPPYLGNSPAEILVQLAVTLWASVHPGFDRLGDPQGLAPLLARFTSSRGKRTAAGKGNGKLSAAQIVVELNKLARFPLGKQLNYRSIQNAQRTASKK